MDKDIFISYSSKDENIVKTVLDRLDKSDISYWFAPKDIEVGEEHDKVIIPAIASAKIFVIFLSKHTRPTINDEKVSKWVRAELLTAIDYDDLYILPIKLDDTVDEPTTNLAYRLLPNYLDLTVESLDFSLNKLCLTIKNLLIDENYKKEYQNFKEIYKTEEKKILTEIEKSIKKGFYQKANELIQTNIFLRKKYRYDIILYETILMLSKNPVKDMEMEQLRYIVDQLRELRESVYESLSYYLEAMISESYFKYNGIKNTLTLDYSTLKNRARSIEKIKTKYFLMTKGIINVNSNFEIDWLK